MQLILDAGNSFLKIALFNQDDKIVRQSTTSYNENSLNTSLSEFADFPISKIGYCSVVNHNIKKQLQVFFDQKIIEINRQSNLSIKTKYETPNTLGIDRLIACAGARKLNSTQPLLVIDIGTCITYDFLDSNNVHYGGAISPGLQLRVKAMHNYTDHLPLVDLNITDMQAPANSTTNALKSGVLKGVLFELQGFINEKKHFAPNLQVFLTGGDAIFFEDALKNGIFAQRNLNLIGLNELLKLNA